MPRFTFLRHAQSASNAAGWFSGHTDVPLTPTGEAQARAMAEQLAGETFSRAWSSDLQRAVHTARLVLGPHPQVALASTPHLRERDLGAWTGARVDELFAQGGREVLYSVDGTPPEGENLGMVALRVLPWILEQPPAEHTLVVAHGGTLRVILGLLDGVPWAEVAEHHVDNCTPFVREATASDWQRALDRVRAGA